MIGGYWKLIDFIFVYLFLSSANIENLFYAFNWFFSDDATLIMVNLFIRSFAKIDDVKMEYSVQITFRWQEDLLFSRWPRFPGKSGPMIVWPIPTSWAKPTWKVGWWALRNINQYNILGLRSDQVLDNDRCWQSVDAGHLFQVDQSIYIYVLDFPQMFNLLSLWWIWAVVVAGTRRRGGSTTSSCQTFTFASFQMATSSTASGCISSPSSSP